VRNLPSEAAIAAVSDSYGADSATNSYAAMPIDHAAAAPTAAAKHSHSFQSLLPSHVMFYVHTSAPTLGPAHFLPARQ
jgi:hypothetical protein